MFVFLNNQLIEAEKATLHISDLAIQRGYGIFDFFRVRENVLLYVEDHLDRFIQSAKFMHLSCPYSKDQLHFILGDLQKKNNLPNSSMRMILTGGYSPDAYQPAESNLIIMQSPLAFQDSLVPKSVSIITHEYVRDVPEAKTINYTMGIWLQPKLAEQKADDVLYHIDGAVSEFPRCNFFIVTKDDVIITSAKNALKGVTRKKIIECAKPHYKVVEGTVTIDDILNAKEAFLSSSTKRIQAITKINGQPIGNGEPGKVTTDLLKLLVTVEQNYVTQKL
jgi:branched-chain amino acid aminotransferase